MEALTVGRRLRALAFSHDCIAALDFGDISVPLAQEDAVILAVTAGRGLACS
jgi:hypothetical protein